MDPESHWLDAVSIAAAIGISRNRFDSLRAVLRPDIATITDPLSRSKNKRLYRLDEVLRFLTRHLDLTAHQIATLEETSRYILPGDRNRRLA